jgi:hypothetical protein
MKRMADDGKRLAEAENARRGVAGTLPEPAAGGK